MTALAAAVVLLYITGFLHTLLLTAFDPSFKPLPLWARASILAAWPLLIPTACLVTFYVWLQKKWVLWRWARSS